MIVSLVPIEIASIYFKNGLRVFLPERFAHCTPDTQAALLQIGHDVEERGGKFYLSDLFRSHDMQQQAHMDFVTGKKSAFSPAPVGSMHEAGRGFDIDLSAIKMPLKDFWEIAAQYGVMPIIKKPDSQASEAWHFDCRGSHDLVFEYYRARKGTNISAPYKAMAMSAVLTAGIPVEDFAGRQREALIQSGLIRLGQTIGSMDGFIGPKTRAGLEAVGVTPTGTLDEIQAGLRLLLEAQFPGEHFPQMIQFSEEKTPKHFIT